MKSIRTLLALVSASAWIALPAGAADEKKVDFAKDVQPILLKSCVQCHGPEKQKGKLRLDSKADAFKETSNIVAGKADESELYKRITLPPGHDDIMPNEGQPLSKAQTDLIRDWINQGAAWPEGLVLKAAGADKAEKDPRTPIQPSADEQKAIAQLQELGVQVRPIAMNVTWTLANFRGVDSNNVPKALPHLSHILTLDDLNLAGLPVQDDHLKAIAGLTNLTRLHLEKTLVTDAGLAHLKRLQYLQYLNLYNTAVTDAALDQLQALKSLKNLYLWQTKVTEDGAKKLKAALPKTDINRGWEMTVAKAAETKEAKADDKKGEAKKPEEKKAEPKKEEPKKEEPKKEEAKKPEAKADKPAAEAKEQKAEPAKDKPADPAKPKEEKKDK